MLIAALSRHEEVLISTPRWAILIIGVLERPLLSHRKAHRQGTVGVLLPRYQ